MAVAAQAAHAQGDPCGAADRKCEAISKARNLPVTRISFWREQFRLPFESRAGFGSAELVEYMALDAIRNDIPDVPRRANPPAGFMQDLHQALAELPPSVKRLVESRFAGVYLVDNIGSTGFTDDIFDAAGNRVAGFIVLDPTVLASRTANEWGTWREATPFKPSAGFSLEARIEAPSANTRANAMQYILLHELAHVLSIGNRIHPPWGGKPAAPQPGRYPYFDMDWVVRDGQYATVFDEAFPERGNIVYYFGPRLALHDAAAVYGQLERTDFVSLYAATHPADDFAEAFASYVHTQLMGRPFEITIKRDGEPIERFEACWSQPRCAAKKRWFDALFSAR